MPDEANTKPQRHILVIDDDPDCLTILGALLTANGYLVESASDAETGLRLVAQRLPDLIVLDVMMPGMNGVEFTRKLKAYPVTATIPLIMLTALTEKRYMKAALFELDVDYYLTKPYDPDNLLEKVEHAIQYRRVQADAVQSPGKPNRK
jgi:DNA-binding response OmpR family regulator